MKKIAFILLLLGFMLPALAVDEIEVVNDFISVVSVPKESIVKKGDKLYFKTKNVYKKGHEESFEGKMANYEIWDTVVNCKTYYFDLKTVHFYDKDNVLLGSENTDDVSYASLKGVATPGSRVFKVIVAACSAE